ncbi:MAG: hypothetical protein HQL66_03315 [Magnetococcales bacterium]|nr:hypothetical protein [Magnetococcales bacterium]
MTWTTPIPEQEDLSKQLFQSHFNAIDGMDKRFDYDNQNRPIYLGSAAAGSLTTAAAWRIQKITYDSNGNGNVTAITAAGGKATFDRVWDSRATYSY